MLEMFKLFQKLWNSRDIVWRLAKTDLKIRYAGSYLGIFWSFLEPLLIIAVYSIVFPLILKMDFLEWFLFFICGLIPFRYIKKSITEITTCLVDYSSILERSRVGPEKVVVAKSISTSISFLLESLIIFILTAFFVRPSFYLLLYIPLFLITFLFNLGVGFYLSSLYPRMRDLNYILNVVFEALLFLTPIVYRIEHIPSLYRGIYALNPLTRLVCLYQETFLKNSPVFVEYFSPLHELPILFFFSLVTFIIGWKKFRKEVDRSLEMV